MLRLRTLGLVDLRDDDGRESASLLSAPKRLALLAYLALARPAGFRSRDELLALFWPEHDAARARTTLRQTLRLLRRDLGPGVLDTRGDAVGVADGALWCDAIEFERGLDAGRVDDAIALYGGDLLHGFHLPGESRGFEDWRSGEAARLRERAARALWALAESAEADGRAAEAERRWHALARVSPYDEAAARRLIERLAGNGNRAGAIGAYEAFAARLAADLELRPSQETASLLAGLRAEEPAGGRVPRPSPPPTASPTPEPAAAGNPAPPQPAETVGGAGRPARGHHRPWVRRHRAALTGLAAVFGLAALGSWLVPGAQVFTGEAPDAVRVTVMPFVHASGTAARARPGQGLAERIAATLDVVPGLEILPWIRASPPANDPSPAGARAAPGADAVIAGSLEPAGDQVRIHARLLGPDGQVRWSAAYEYPVGDTAGLKEEVSLRVADALRLRLVPYEPKVYTENEAAYERFLDGVFAQRRMTREDTWKALQYYREAYEQDSGFALAHAIAANAYMHYGGVSREVAFEQARAHALHALTLDSTLAEGHAAMGMIHLWWDWDFAAAERSLRRAIMLYPTLPQARSNYGAYQIYVRGRLRPGLANIRRALEVDPLNTGRSSSVERALYAARRYEDVLEQHRTTRELAAAANITATAGTVAGALRELGRHDEALADLMRMQERTGRPSAALAVTYARMGRTADARRLLPELRALAQSCEIDPVAMATVHAALGERDAAFEWLERGYERRVGRMLMLLAEPALDALRSEPRFDELARRIGLSPARLRTRVPPTTP